MVLNEKAVLLCALVLSACYEARGLGTSEGSPEARARFPKGPFETPLVELRGATDNELFGLALIAVPDLTGDGLAELLIGAPGARDGRGGAYLMAGPFTHEQNAGDALLTLEGSRPGGRAGESLAVGDTGGDGELELLIGSPQSYDGTGSADLLRASARGRLELALDAPSDAQPINFGLAAAMAPAGHGDSVLVGVPHLGRAYAGAVLIFREPSLGPLQLADSVGLMEAETKGAHAGTSLSAGCDANGDGKDDLLIGAWGDDSGATGGSAHLVLGPLESQSIEGAYADFYSSVPGAAAGSRVLLADLDDDSLCDVLVGAPGESQKAGAVYGFLRPLPGKLDLLEADFRIRGAEPGDGVGLAFTASDQDGDGVLDLWIGAPGHDEAGPESGAVYLVYGTPAGTITLSSEQPRLLGKRADDHLGAALAGGRDLDGDGSHDIAAGAWAADAPASNSGSVYVLRNVAGTPRGEKARRTQPR